MQHLFDELVFVPGDIDLSYSPLAVMGVQTHVLGAFNPALTRMPGGNLLLMVRVAEALCDPVSDGFIHALRWDEVRGYVQDAWPLDSMNRSDPRVIRLRDAVWPTIALTSLSWLLPVELSADGRSVVACHYDRIIAPAYSYQAYGIEDPRISRVGDRWLMTTCSVSPERQCTVLYSSSNALDWQCEGIVLDHQNKDMLIFEGLVNGLHWAQTRPLGDIYFAYPPGSDWRAGPSINLATSPDGLYWKPYERPGIRPHAATGATARIGGGAPPILTEWGWLSLWHGVENNDSVGIYRTFATLLKRDDPACVVGMAHQPVLEPAPHLTAALKSDLYLHDIVFTTGIVDAGDCFIVASGEADLACRITHIAKTEIDRLLNE